MSECRFVIASGEVCSVHDLSRPAICNIGLAALRAKLGEQAAIIEAVGYEKDELRAKASAASAREAEARHRATRLSIDSELRARVAELEEALRPFAALLSPHHDSYKDVCPVFSINDKEICISDLRRAAALTPPPVTKEEA